MKNNSKIILREYILQLILLFFYKKLCLKINKLLLSCRHTKWR